MPELLPPPVDVRCRDRGGAVALRPTVAAAAPGGRAVSADVVVVGADCRPDRGRVLTAAGRRVVVLEARDRVGGRTLNHPLPGGHVADLGGTWIGRRRTRSRLAASGLATFAEVDEGTADHQWRPLPQWRRTGGAPPDPTILPDLVAVIALVDQMSRSVPVDAPWTAEKADEVGQPDVRHVAPRAHRLAADPHGGGGGVQRPVRGRGTRDLAPLRALVHRLRRRREQPRDLRAAHRRAGRRSGAALRRGRAVDVAAHGRRTRRPRATLLPGAEGRADGGRRTGGQRPAHGRGCAGDPGGATHARRPDRLRPAAAHGARPLHAAQPAGPADQGGGPVRTTVLARRRAVRRGGQRHRPGQDLLRRHAGRQRPRRPARVRRRRRGAEVGR